MILVLSVAHDRVADVVAGKLRERGTTVHVLDPADFPRHWAVSARIDRTNASFLLQGRDGTRIDLQALSGVWVGRPGDPIAPDVVEDPVAREFVARESARFLDDLWDQVDCRWVPARPAALRPAERRLGQLRLALRHGLSVPTTLATTEPDAVLSFHRAHDGDVVSKLAAQMLDYSHHMRYTRRVSPLDLLDHRSVAHAPLILQKALPKVTEVRATVVGDRVLTAEIDAQGSARARDDWRHYDYGRTRYRAHDLPAAVARSCRRMTHALGLTFSAIDLVVTEDGTYEFVDLNPNGQWWWLEQTAGLPLSDAVADLLLSEAAARA